MWGERRSVTLHDAVHSPHMASHFEDFVGRYALVVDPALLDFIERTFVDPVPEGRRAAARKEALDEARAATLEIGADGSVVSRAGEETLYRAQLVVGQGTIDELTLEKPGGAHVTLRLLDARTLLAAQEGRPLLTFERATELARALV
jgi:hypothetical protein